jgi:hypothetical protein
MQTSNTRGRGSCKTSHTSDAGLLNVKDNVQYTPIYPSRNDDLNDVRQGRIQEGVQIMMEQIQRAIGQVPAGKQ